MAMPFTSLSRSIGAAVVGVSYQVSFLALTPAGNVKVFCAPLEFLKLGKCYSCRPHYL